MTKKQLLQDRQALLDEVASLQDELLRLRSGEPPKGLQAAAEPGEITAYDDETALPQSGFSRFPLLRAVDEANGTAPDDDLPPGGLDMPELVAHLRRYAAAHFGLYANKALFAHFLGAMAAGGFVLLRGGDADGKRGPLLLCQAVAGALGQSAALTTVQPGWSGPANLLGSLDPSLKLYHETAFLRTMYAALYDDGPCFAALDRITDAPYDCFAPLLAASAVARGEGARLLGQGGFPLAGSAWPGDPLLLQEGAMPYPDNLWLFGVVPPEGPAPGQRLRAAAMEFAMPPLTQKPFAIDLGKPVKLSAAALRERFELARQDCELPGELLEKYHLAEQYLADNLDLSIGVSAQTQLPRFCGVCMDCGLTPEQALDGFFYHRALRRLDTLDPAALRYGMEGLRAFMEDTFGKRQFPMTMGLLRDDA